MNREDLELLENVMGALASVGDTAEMIKLRLDQPELDRQRPYLVEELRELMAAHEEARRSLVNFWRKRSRGLPIGGGKRGSRAPDGVEQLSLFGAQDPL